ncbi:MAG: response regulator [Cyanobium sp.]
MRSLPPLEALAGRARSLAAAGFAAAPRALGLGLPALALLAMEPFDRVMLDGGMPGSDGVEVSRWLRRGQGLQPLVLMLTARDSSADKVLGLDCGADDDVVKPLEPAAAGPHPGPAAALRPALQRRAALEARLRSAGQSCSKARLLNGSASG